MRKVILIRYTYTISSTTPTRSGYKFLGYNTTNTTTANTNYAPGKTITLTAANPTLTLYAIWEATAPAVTGFGGITQMQQMTTSICANASGSGQLYDTRDNKTYTVQKIGAQCWMTQNLAFDIAQATNAMSTDNSDVVSNWSWPTTPTRYTTGTGWNTNDNAVAYITTPTVQGGYTGDGGGYRSVYGYYYSWCAATAGCKDASGNNPVADVDAASSICPKGWKLPKGGSGVANDFAKMAGISSATTSNQWSSVTNISFSGYTLSVNGSSWLAAGDFFPAYGLRYPGTEGHYWSRTGYNSYLAYDLFFNSSSFYPAESNDYGYNRRDGFSVRCVAYSS